MCGCEYHWDPNAKCTCHCRHAPLWRRVFYRYRPGALAPGEAPSIHRPRLEMKRHHWLVSWWIRGWVYCVRVVWR